MENAKGVIVQTERANKLKYYLSIVEKENEIGLYNNERMLFLLSGHHLGYLSKIDQKRLEDIKFEGAKVTILLPDISKVQKKLQDQMEVTFRALKDGTWSQKIWYIKFSSDILCKRWIDLIRKERDQYGKPKVEDIQPVVQVAKMQEGINTMQKEKKPLQMVSRNMEVAEKSKIQKVDKDTKEIGTSVSPKHSQHSNQKSRLNSQEQLARIMNEGSSRHRQVGQTSRNKDTQTDKVVQPTLVNKSIRSQPSHLKGHQFSYRILEASKKSDQLSHSDPNNKSSNQLLSPQDRNKQVKWMDQDKEQSPINQITNKKYLESMSIAQSDYMDKGNSNLRKSEMGDSPNPKNRNFGLSIPKYQEEFQKGQKRQNYSLYRFNYPDQRAYKFPQGEGRPWTFKFIKYHHLMFDQFRVFTEKLMMELIVDLGRSIDSRRYKVKLLKNNIAYFDIDDVEVKLALITLDTLVSEGKEERVSNKKAIKMLQNQFSDYSALYEYLGDNVQLRVPMVSLCEYQGFVGLFKILSKNKEYMVRSKDLVREIEDLKYRSKIDCNFNQNLNRVIIQLDGKFYNSIKHTGETQSNFNLYFIQQIDRYLLPDSVEDQEAFPKVQILRKELIEGFNTDLHSIRNQLSESLKFKEPFVYKQHSKELQKLSLKMAKKIDRAAKELDSLAIYFMNPSELSDYFHSKGINIRYIGKVYEHLTTMFQKRILMTEIAARSCKTLFRKTIQDILIEDAYLTGENDFQCKICDFLNGILGMTHETAELWNVLSVYSRAYFGLKINFSQIDRWFLVISLVEHCRLNVSWNRVGVQQAFRTNTFFGDKNIEGVNFKHKIYKPLYCQYYRLARQIIEAEESRQNFDRLVSYLSLKVSPIPAHLHMLKAQINKYLCFFISPEKAKQNQYIHLKLYDTDNVLPGRIAFDIMLVEIKWHLKLKKKEQYIRACNEFIKVATKFYGEFHPIFSQLYDIFSAYHLASCQYQDSITFAKSSLVNTLKICSTSHLKTSDCYYNLALCYIKAGRAEEAIIHLKKSKLYFQNSGQKDNIAHAVMDLKLGLLYLNQNQIKSALECTAQALRMVELNQEREDASFQDQVTECFQVMARCYEIAQDKASIRQLSLECLPRLKTVQNPQNLQKMLKIYLYPILSNLDCNISSVYIDLLVLMTFDIADGMYESSFKLLKKRVDEQTFRVNLETYLDRLMSISQHIKDRQLLRGWQLFAEEYPRETVKDFISLSTELMGLLGENFLMGALRESL